ncbi:hotdog fold thioesterase [Bdellovibrionota bacterium FG-1]
MAIWFKSYTLEDLRKRSAGTMMEFIGIEFTEIGDDFLVGTMPVDHRTKQPAGLLHGGASCVLAETVASMAANMVVDSQESACVGLEINANHLHSCRDGFVTGKASPLHLGRSTQVWEIKIHQDDQLVCVSRLTLAVRKR